jgi:hypothetical protein
LDELCCKSFFPEEYGETGVCPILNNAVDSDDAHLQLLQEVSQALTAWEGDKIKLLDLGKKGREIRFDADACAANFVVSAEVGIILVKPLGDKKYRERSGDVINLLV